MLVNIWSVKNSSKNKQNAVFQKSNSFSFKDQFLKKDSFLVNFRTSECPPYLEYIQINKKGSRWVRGSPQFAKIFELNKMTTK